MYNTHKRLPHENRDILVTKTDKVTTFTEGDLRDILTSPVKHKMKSQIHRYTIQIAQTH